VRKSVSVEQIAFFTTTRRISHHSGCSTSKNYWSVTEHLKTTQADLAKQVANMQRV
jgi:hypothetical protein